jgi:hypothetical protein
VVIVDDAADAVAAAAAAADDDDDDDATTTGDDDALTPLDVLAVLTLTLVVEDRGEAGQEEAIEEGVDEGRSGLLLLLLLLSIKVVFF